MEESVFILQSKKKTHFMWAPYSPDLNPLDLFLWGPLKDMWLSRHHTRSQNSYKKSHKKMLLMLIEI